MNPLHKPLEVIFPILLTGVGQGSPYSVLGTGFYIGRDGIFMTARHVFGDLNPPPEREYAVSVVENGADTVLPITELRFHDRFDIAVGRALGSSAGQHFEFADRNPYFNDAVVTVEFSDVVLALRPDGATEVAITPSHHKGHIVAFRESRIPGLEGVRILDMSFPALKGASGAPIVLERNGQVAGMVLGNLERHLLPAHVEKIESESGETETHQYFLPRAYAISWVHLREAAGLSSGDADSHA